jgi:hypothetical protein
MALKRRRDFKKHHGVVWGEIAETTLAPQPDPKKPVKPKTTPKKPPKQIQPLAMKERLLVGYRELARSIAVSSDYAWSTFA